MSVRAFKLLFYSGMSLAALLPLQAVTLTENFSTDPLPHGWRIFGDTNLFRWNTTNQNLDVTWDSSHTNSYFYLPLSNILCKSDNFSLSFDLVLKDYVIGTTPGRPYTFPVAVGFLNLINATQTNFARGSGVNSVYGPKNLVEFDFFPAFDIFLPTIDQVVVSTNNTWLYNHDNLLDMPPGDLFHINMDYNSTTRTLSTTITRNGFQYGSTQSIQVPANSFDFRVAAVSVSSYSDQQADGSILAHGTVDNIVVTTPPPPVQNLRGYFTSTQWHVEFLSRSNWLYTLQRTTDFATWTNVSPDTPGIAGTLILPDANAPKDKASYRVTAIRL